MECEFCHEEIKGKTYIKEVGTCHPVVLYRDAKICRQCKLFPHNNVESNETLIK